MISIKEFMAEKKEINRWFVAVVFMAGMLCGVILATMYYVGLTALIK